MAALRRPALSIAAIAAYCACLLLSSFFLPDSGSARPWNGTRLFASSMPVEAVIAGLESIGIHDVIHEGGQIVSFSAFDGWGSVSLPELDVRLMEGDPRRDGFIDNASRYFFASSEGQSLRLYYLMDAFAPYSILVRRLRMAFGPEGWTLIEGGRKKGWVEGAVAWLLVVVVLLATGRKKALPALVSLLGWGGIFLSSSWTFILSCLPAMACGFLSVWAFSRYPYEKEPTIPSFIRIAVDEIGWGVIIPLGLGSLVAFILFPASYSLAFSAASIGAILPMLLSRARRPGTHRTFMPLRLGKGRGNSFMGSEAKAFSIVLATVASALSLMTYVSSTPRKTGIERNSLLSFPHPRGYTERVPDGVELPGLIEYLDHVAYQAGFLGSDLSGKGRAFKAYTRKGDGALEEREVKAGRLPTGANPEGRGIERVLRLAGEKSRIAYLPWDSGGAASPDGGWAIPIVLSAVLVASAAFLLGKGVGRGRGRGKGRPSGRD